MEISFGNIAAHNGWAMAFVGYVTVICALAILATLISLMPKIIIAMEAMSPSKRNKKDTQAPVAKTQPIIAATADAPLLDTAVLTAEYGPYVGELNASFELKDLYALAKEKDLEHPHLSITALQEAGKIVPEGDGLFKWNA